jgi:hypothetical protein
MDEWSIQMIIVYLIAIAILSGILGRLGGRAKDGSWYDVITDSKARDVGCSLLTLCTLWLLFGFHLKYWLIYICIFGLSWGAISLYWDFLFGYDNFWFSGFVTGLALIPLLWCGRHILPIGIRSCVLALIWGGLHKYLPSKVLIWDRAVAEEFLRYFSLIITLIIK